MDYDSGTAKDGSLVADVVADILDPVKDADGYVPPGSVTTFDEEFCTNSYAYTAGSTTVIVLYAEHAYPGKSVQDLARVAAIAHLRTGIGYVPGYEHYVNAPPLAKDGYVAYPCGYQSDPTYDRVTFVATF
jgi:hypothetical protein